MAAARRLRAPQTFRASPPTHDAPQPLPRPPLWIRRRAQHRRRPAAAPQRTPSCCTPPMLVEHSLVRVAGAPAAVASAVRRSHAVPRARAPRWLEYSSHQRRCAPRPPTRPRRRPGGSSDHVPETAPLHRVPETALPLRVVPVSAPQRAPARPAHPRLECPRRRLLREKHRLVHRRVTPPRRRCDRAGRSR